jgi:Flp pilus assembly protein TadD
LDTAPDLGRRAYLLAAVGKNRQAMAQTSEIEDMAPLDSSALSILAGAYVLMGDLDQALLHLDQAYELGHEDPYFILINPPLRGLQERPEIRDLAPY